MTKEVNRVGMPQEREQFSMLLRHRHAIQQQARGLAITATAHIAQSAHAAGQEYGHADSPC